MAPTLNINTPKAPDKNENDIMESAKEKKSAKALNNLNECELKDLLEETMSYKNPKDREGKSSLFKELLDEAEESERNARATSAGGSEQVRYCNTTAKHRSKHRRKPSSISENVMHGGSLDNLAKEELFNAVCHPYKPKRTVSARQREGGSLPSNVNSGSLAAYSPAFLEEARRGKKEHYENGGAEESETASLIENDQLGEKKTYTSSAMLELVEAVPAPKYTTQAKLQVNVDDGLHISELEQPSEQKAKVVQSHYSVYIQNYQSITADGTKKVDENGNALHQNSSSKTKKKKIQSDKNVTVVAAEKVVGHRGDIINDLNKLLEFIEDEPTTKQQRQTRPAKNQLHKHSSHEEAPVRGNRKVRPTVGDKKDKKESTGAAGTLKKSNSMGDVRSSNADIEREFSLNNGDADGTISQEDDKVVFRGGPKKDKMRERRSWGNVEPNPFQALSKSPSSENLEQLSMADFCVVTKKKKMKKRRSSASEGRRSKTHPPTPRTLTERTPGEEQKSGGSNRREHSGVRRKHHASRSVPHSEKSNDDSSSSDDVDSVRSLPIDAGVRGNPEDYYSGAPVSYAAIARNADPKTPKDKKSNVERSKEQSPNPQDATAHAVEIVPNCVEVAAPPVAVAHPHNLALIPSSVSSTFASKVPPPPDVTNIKSFPSIKPTNKSKSPPADKAVGVGIKNGKIGENDDKKIANKRNTLSDNPQESFEKDVLNESPSSDHGPIVHQSPPSVQYQVPPSSVGTVPLHILDVQTIEKMHFANHHPGAPPAVHPAPSHLANHHMVSVADMFGQCRYAVAVPGQNHYVYAPAPIYLSNIDPQSFQHHQQPITENGRKNVKFNSQKNREKVSQMNHPMVKKERQPRVKDDSPVNDKSGDSENFVSAEMPPVVILTESGNKEVPGLVFGFDINEQLLSEEVCEKFCSRFLMPDVFTTTSHNHDKIVNFIGTAWEETWKNQKVQYYSEKS